MMLFEQRIGEQKAFYMVLKESYYWYEQTSKQTQHPPFNKSV